MSYIKDLNSQYEWLRKKTREFSDSLSNDATICDGVMKWKSNNHCVPRDVAELAIYIGLPVDMDKHEKARDEETERFLASYRKQQKNRKRTQEELFEMRAAFGIGETVIDIITGERITL